MLSDDRITGDNQSQTLNDKGRQAPGQQDDCAGRSSEEALADGLRFAEQIQRNFLMAAPAARARAYRLELIGTRVEGLGV